MPRQQMIVPVFIPHQGCPYRCVFCNQDEISGEERRDDQARLDEALQTYLQPPSELKLPPYRELAFYGGTFTALPAKRQEFLLATGQAWVDRRLIQSLRLSTHPSAVNAEALNLLSRYSVGTIELGVQSTDPQVLERSGRADTSESLPSAIRLIKAKGYRLGLQLMSGLPGDCELTFAQTVRDTIDYQPDYVRIYPALVVRGTALHTMYQKGEYRPWTLERTVEALKEAVRKFENAGIRVIRLGLHPEPSLLENWVAGPYHPSLRSLVDSRICFDELSNLLNGREGGSPRVVFGVPLRKVSNYTGHAKENSLKLKEKFFIKELVFKEVPGLSAPELLV